MQNSSLILVLSENSQMQTVRDALAEKQESFQLQCVERASTALARISGGGVGAVLFDWSVPCGSPDEALRRFKELHAGAPGIPIIVMCRPEDENLARAAVALGAKDYVIREQSADRLAPLLLSATKTVRQGIPAATVDRDRGGMVIAFLGVKGGVGTTSVAVNVAASLAQASRAVVVELRPTIATLSHLFCPRSAIRTISALLEPAGVITPERLQKCLWSHRRVPGLSILFGPQTLQDCLEIHPHHVQTVLTALAGMVEFVVIDLPPALSAANRAAIQGSDCLALVLERDPICLPMARLMMREIESWNMAARMYGPVVVNRVPLSSPFPIDDIERELGMPPLGVIGPAPDLFLAAQRVGTPVVGFQPESLAAGTLAAVAARLAAERPSDAPIRMGPPPMARDARTSIAQEVMR